MANAVPDAAPFRLTGRKAVSAGGLRLRLLADTALNRTAQLWFLVAVSGQWAFASYVAVFYGRSAARGDFEAWNRVAPHSYVPGETLANLAVAMHLLLAVVVMVGGPLQLVPRIRSYAPSFHRWTGRVYLVAVFATALAGLFMIWGRGTVGGLLQHLGSSLDAVLIVTFAVLALRFALARDFKTHRRWALRLFMVVNGVWFFRVGLKLWMFVNGGPVGFDPRTFTGPFLDVWSFADYLLPLAILELYLRAKERAGVGGRLAMASGLVVVTLAMGVGMYLASLGWLSRLLLGHR